MRKDSPNHIDISMLECFRKSERQSAHLLEGKSDFDALIDQLRSSAFVKHMNEMRASIIN